MIDVLSLISEMEEQLVLINEATGRDRELRVEGLKQYLKGLKHGLGASESGKGTKAPEASV